jgi:hypothetical protein
VTFPPAILHGLPLLLPSTGASMSAPNKGTAAAAQHRALGLCAVQPISDSSAGRTSTSITSSFAVMGGEYSTTTSGDYWKTTDNRRIRIFLNREGHAMTWGRCYRLWRRARRHVLRRRPRKRIATSRPQPQAPTGTNQVRYGRTASSSTGAPMA